jgi:hypothetical protein
VELNPQQGICHHSLVSLLEDTTKARTTSNGDPQITLAHLSKICTEVKEDTSTSTRTEVKEDASTSTRGITPQSQLPYWQNFW